MKKMILVATMRSRLHCAASHFWLRFSCSSVIVIVIVPSPWHRPRHSLRHHHRHHQNHHIVIIWNWIGITPQIFIIYSLQFCFMGGVPNLQEITDNWWCQGWCSKRREWSSQPDTFTFLMFRKKLNLHMNMNVPEICSCYCSCYCHLRSSKE